LPGPGVIDLPVGVTTSGAFGHLGPLPGLTFAQQGTAGLQIVGSLLTPGSGDHITNVARAYDALTGLPRLGFPAREQGLGFLAAPLFGDVTGDGQAELITVADTSTVHAVDGLGQMAAGFPKYNGGWGVFSPS